MGYHILCNFFYLYLAASNRSATSPILHEHNALVDERIEHNSLHMLSMLIRNSIGVPDERQKKYEANRRVPVLPTTASCGGSVDINDRESSAEHSASSC